MKPGGPKTIILTVLLLGAAVGIGWVVLGQFQDRSGTSKGARASRPAPVEVAQIQRGPVVLQRAFSGELEALSEFVVAPKVSGRVERVIVNIADPVKRGQVVAELVDSDQEAGHHVVQWNAGDLASGVYFYRIEANDFTATRRMVLMK